MNMNNAYLINNLNKNIYIKILKEYNLLKDYHDKSSALKLLKNLYSLKQSEYIWNKKFKAVLVFIDFESISTDNCIFINYNTDVIISLYINNLFLFIRKLSVINNVKQSSVFLI